MMQQFCMRARFVEEVVGPHASCNDYCIMLCWSYLVGGGGGGCSCILLHPVPLALMLTFAPCVPTFAPCPCGVFIFELLQPFHLHRWWLSPVATCDDGAFLCSHWYLQSIASEVFTRGRFLKATFSKETIFTLSLGDYSSTGQQGG